MPDSKWDVTKTRNGERGTGNGGNEKLEQNRELDVKLLIAVGFKLVFFSIVRLIYSFLASREASFQGIRWAGANFSSARRIP